MTRSEIIANTKTGAARAASGKFGVTPRQSKHVARMAELKKRIQRDEKHNEDAFAPAELRRVAG